MVCLTNSKMSLNARDLLCDDLTFSLNFNMHIEEWKIRLKICELKIFNAGQSVNSQYIQGKETKEQYW